MNLKIKIKFSRRVLFFLSMFICFSCIGNLAEVEKTTMEFKKILHDFGEIPMDKSISTKFLFLNTGDIPLVIKDIKTSCGCTVPNWEKKEVLPGEGEEIEIVYDAKKPGKFRRSVYVYYNSDQGPMELTIKGEVDYLNFFE